MPSAFDRTTPPSEHNPLQNLLDYDPSKIPLNLATLIETWINSIEEFIFPIVKDLTGIDLSSPEHFFASVALLIINGGETVMDFVNAIVSFIVDALTGLTGGGLPDLTAWAGDIPILSDIVEAITGIVGGGLPDIVTWAEGLADSVAGAVSGLADLVSGLLSSPATFLGDIPQSLVTGLTGALGTLTSNLSALISNLLSAPASVLGALPQSLVSGLSGALGTLTDGLGDITGIINDVINAIVSAFRKIPFVGGLVGGLAAIGDSVQEQQVNQQNATITVASTLAYKNPAWVCRYPIADVSYPEAMNQRMPVNGVTSAQSAGTAHTHVIDGNSVEAAPASWNIPQNAALGVVITASSTVVYDTLGITMKVLGTAPTSVIPEVFREDSSGGMVKVATLSDVSSLLSTTATYIELPLSPPLIAQPGERFMVLVSNRSSTAQAAYILGLKQPAYLDMSGRVFPSGAAVSSFTASQMTSAIRDTLPWAMLASKTAAPQDLSFSDDFNRTSLGSFWQPSDVLAVTSNRVSYKGTTNGLQHAIYTRPVSGDQMLAEANVYDRITNPRLGVMACCNREFTQVVYLGVNLTTANIYTGAWNSLTQRASVTTGFGDAKFGLYNDPSTSTFTILRDDTDIGSWIDTGGIVQLGYDYRFGGIRIDRGIGGNAGTLDNFTLKDAAL